jgi:hypothetical protein
LRSRRLIAGFGWWEPLQKQKERNKTKPNHHKIGHPIPVTTVKKDSSFGSCQINLIYMKKFDSLHNYILKKCLTDGKSFVSAKKKTFVDVPGYVVSFIKHQQPNFLW